MFAPIVGSLMAVGQVKPLPPIIAVGNAKAIVTSHAWLKQHEPNVTEDGRVSGVDNPSSLLNSVGFVPSNVAGLNCHAYAPYVRCQSIARVRPFVVGVVQERLK